MFYLLCAPTRLMKRSSFLVMLILSVFGAYRFDVVNTVYAFNTTVIEKTNNVKWFGLFDGRSIGKLVWNSEDITNKAIGTFLYQGRYGGNIVKRLNNSVEVGGSLGILQILWQKKSDYSNLGFAKYSFTGVHSRYICYNDVLFDHKISIFGRSEFNILFIPSFSFYQGFLVSGSVGVSCNPKEYYYFFIEGQLSAERFSTKKDAVLNAVLLGINIGGYLLL